MNALLIKLLNMSAAGSVLILAVVVLRAVLKKAPRWILCLMWALVAIRLVCPVSLASPVSAFQATPSLVSESGEVEVFRPAGGSEKPMLAVDIVQIERPRTNAETIREIPGTSYAVTQRSRDAYLPPLVQGYLLGLAAMLLYAAVSTLLLRKKVSASVKLEGNIRICDAVPSPFILGLVRPTVYLPSSLSEEERGYVLAHERAHLRRRDHWWKPLGFLILSIHWFNPLCWLAYVLLCRDIELACDEKVVRELGREARAAYSQTLLNSSAHRVLAACPVAFGETGVKTRVRAVLNYKKPAFWIILLALLGCVVLAVCLMTKPLREPDLSFLNYKNAIPLIGQNDTAPYAVLYPADTNGQQPGVADNKALAQFLAGADWTERPAPAPAPEPRGCIEFMIEDDYRIMVYQSERLAAVRFGNDARYYRTGAGDYEAALAAFIPAPSTVPDRAPEQGVNSDFDRAEYLPLYESVLDQYHTVLESASRGEAAPSGREEGDAEDYDSLLGSWSESILVQHFFDRDPLGRVGWTLTDLNGDRVPELLIGSVENEEEFGLVLFDLYTISDGVPVRIAQSFERFRYYDLGGGQLLEESSSLSGGKDWILWKMSGGELRFEDGHGYHEQASDENGPWYGIYSASSWEIVYDRPISESKALAWQQRYTVRKLRHTFTPFADADWLSAPEQGASPTATGWTLQCRVRSSMLAEYTVPAALSDALEKKLARQLPLEGMEARFVEGWGMRYPAGADLLPVFLTLPGENTDPSKCVQRNADGRYGFKGFEAHEEICAILDWLADQTGWPVHADSSEFRSLREIALMNGDEVLLRIEEPERLAAFEALMQDGMYTVGDASKTPMERVELRAKRSDGTVLTLMVDPDNPFVWLPPFGYYRYNAPESTGVRPLLDALGLADWPEELKTFDPAAMSETYLRLQPLAAVQAADEDGQRRMTIADVYTLAEAAYAATEAGQTLSLKYFEDYEGLIIGSLPTIIRFPINDSFCLDVYAEDRGGQITQALLLIADENGAFRPRPGYYIDILKQDIADFLSGMRLQTLSVTSGGVTIYPTLFYYHGMIWTDDGWLFADGLPLEILLADPASIMELTLAEDFRISFDGTRSGLEIYNENLDLVRGEEFYPDTGVNWLEPGSYYVVMEVTVRGREIEAEESPEIGTYRAVFRLIVPEGGAEPYAPNKAVDLTRASLCRNGITGDDIFVLTDPDALTTLEDWLQNAEPFYGDILTIPFQSVLTFTRADGRIFSCCPAEDDSGLIFSNGFYYLLPVGGADFRALFGIRPQ